MTEELKCPICDKPLQPDDLCASDIEMGTCHAECLIGSPVVDLDTGEETPDAKVNTFRAREIMEPGRQQRDKFESAVVKRLSATKGYVEAQIRTQCLERNGSGYVAEAINDMWHFWNEALWQNIPLVDPVLGRSPDGLDFATPNEVFDKGPEAVREWQEARGRKPQTPPPSTHVVGISLTLTRALGPYGSAHDPIGVPLRAYTYEHQPGNGVAWNLGCAVSALQKHPSAGDPIDVGLYLLKEMQARGLGVFEVDPKAVEPSPEKHVAPDAAARLERILRLGKSMKWTPHGAPAIDDENTAVALGELFQIFFQDAVDRALAITEGSADA